MSISQKTKMVVVCILCAVCVLCLAVTVGSAATEEVPNGVPTKSPAATVEIPINSSERAVISLDGVWECTTSPSIVNITTATVPTSYDSLISVPGLWDMASNDLGDYTNASLWYKTEIIMPDDYDSTSDDARITLEIKRAQYGRTVYINGVFVAHFAYNYVNSHTDITQYLNPGVNELVIMLGNRDAQKNDPACIAHTGREFEKTQFYPGITDSVNVIVNGDPWISAVQTAADLANGTIDARIRLENRTAAAATTTVTVNLYELGVFTNGTPSQPRTLVQTSTVGGASVTVGANSRLTLDVNALSVSGFDLGTKAWTPDNPYLYEIEVVTDNDTITKRFGMRTFTYDPVTKHAMLNGEVTYLRGTNIAINRFYEDEQHGDLPWNEQWVRQLYGEFIDTNWNVMRTHLGPAPSIWYDIADELGFMIIDEYGWWTCDDGCTEATLSSEIEQWIDERQNHASIIYWDIQNEDGDTAVTGAVAKALYDTGYDIQNRVWDNGFETPINDSAPIEYHPYLFSDSNFRLDLLNDRDNTRPFNGGKNDNNTTNPKIINEYGWLWLDRNGDPTTLTQDFYDKQLPGATAEQRLEFYADAVAQLTEFWRAGRAFEGIQHFGGLLYSKPGVGATGDILQSDISTPIVHPVIKERFRSAFAPLGIVLENYTTAIGPGQTLTYPVTLINDYNHDIDGLTITFTVAKGNTVLLTETKVYSVKEAGDSNDRATQSFGFTLSQTGLQNGDVLIVTAAYTLDGETISSRRKLTYDSSLTDPVSLNKPVEASSVQNYTDDLITGPYDLCAEYVNDGNTATRWASEWKIGDTRDSWITIDLGKVYNLKTIELNWEYAYGEDYFIQVSDDNVQFTTIYTQTGGQGSIEKFDVEGSGRYVRMQGVSSPSGYGYSLWEFTIWAWPNAEEPPPPDPTERPGVIIVVNSSYTVTFNSMGGSAVAAQNVDAEAQAVKPTDPTREGYTFGGWYIDEACTKPYSFNSSVTEDLTLYAKWDWAWISDAPTGWAQEEVVLAIQNGLVPEDLQQGYKNNMTRLDFCRMAIVFLAQNGYDIDGVVPAEAFGDCNDKAVLVAAALSIVEGTGHGNFEPTRGIRRDEAACMLSRLCDVLGVYNSNAAQTQYNDQSDIRSWARSEINFMFEIKVMEGAANNNFEPLSPYTTETAIVTFQRLLVWFDA